jgi:quercetin dioxygenase-like cupin family protein
MQLRRLVPQGHAARANDSAEKRAKLSAALATDHERENSMKAITHQNDAWEAWRPGVESRMLVSARNGAAQLCMFEQWIAPGVGAPTHSHPVEEVLTVREGEAEMWIEQAHMTMVAGQSLIRAGWAHARLPQFRHLEAAYSRGAGVAGVRGHAGRCDGGDPAVGLDVSDVIPAVILRRELLRASKDGHPGRYFSEPPRRRANRLISLQSDFMSASFLARPQPLICRSAAIPSVIRSKYWDQTRTTGRRLNV